MYLYKYFIFDKSNKGALKWPFTFQHFIYVGVVQVGARCGLMPLCIFVKMTHEEDCIIEAELTADTHTYHILPSPAYQHTDSPRSRPGKPSKLSHVMCSLCKVKNFAQISSSYVKFLSKTHELFTAIKSTHQLYYFKLENEMLPTKFCHATITCFLPNDLL